MATIPCPCAPKRDGELRHPAGDTVTLRERLDYHAAATITKSIQLLKTEDPDASAAEILATMTEAYVLFGIESWTLLDEDGKPLPVTKPHIRSMILANPEAAEVVADAADEQYQEQILLPLLARAANSSPPTPTGSSTSPPNSSRETRRKPSSRSSITSIPTAAIGTITSPPAGDSSGSPNDASAA